jgi:hypothetical protein
VTGVSVETTDARVIATDVTVETTDARVIATDVSVEATDAPAQITDGGGPPHVPGIGRYSMISMDPSGIMK